MYEGLSSNFAALDSENRLLTAPNSSVLMGTVMEVVKIVSTELGIEVINQFPSIDALDKYQNVFITSTSRLVLPIKSLSLPDGTIRLYNVPECRDALFQKLITKVHERLVDRAIDLEE